MLHDGGLWMGGETEIPEMWDPRAGGLRPEAEGMAICSGLSTRTWGPAPLVSPASADPVRGCHLASVPAEGEGGG